MMITTEQHDALAEWVNIGFGRAASSLSDLLGRHINLKAPQVVILSPSEVSAALAEFYPERVVIVHQIFSGGFSGDVIMFLDFSSASVLVGLLSDEEGRARPLNASDREALGEVGNILLNAYVGSFGDLLKSKVRLSLPALHIDRLEEMPRLLSVNGDELQFILLVKTEFSVLSSSVNGYIALIIGVDSLEKLTLAIQSYDGWE